MRILVNAASANMGGATTYLTNTTRWMSDLAPHAHIHIVAPKHSLERLGDLSTPNVTCIPYPYADTGGWRRMWFDQIGVRDLIRSTRSDVLFSTTGFGTWFSPAPQVLLVRNLAYFDPAFHDLYRKLGRSLRRNTIRRWLSVLSIRRADHVLFPTEGMKELVGRWTSFEGVRAEALHYGFERDAVQRQGTTEPSWRDRLSKLKQQGVRILVNVSTFSVQKNLETMIAALPGIIERAGPVALATTTSRDRTTDKTEYDALTKMARDLGVSEHWIELGYVAYQDLGTLYDVADVSVFPSITESFGHSMVESMAFGLPVAAADTLVNREVCGGGGVYFLPTDVASCAETVSTLLLDDVRRREVGEIALARAAEFSWQSHSERLLDIFSQLTAGRN